MRRFRLITVSIAAVFLVAGAAFSFAEPSGNHGSDVSAVAKPTEPPKGSDHGKAVSEVARSNDGGAAEDGEASEGKPNHGFYVSAAAKCEDVDDPATGESPDFSAPDNCDSDGAEHGEYVRSVAKSSLGRPPKGPKNVEEGS